MLAYKAEFAHIANVHYLSEAWDEIEARRTQEQCCVGSMVVVNWLCVRCLDEFCAAARRQQAFLRMKKGDFNWGHCEVAKRRLEQRRDMPNVMTEQKFCATCEPLRKRRRFS